MSIFTEEFVLFYDNQLPEGSPNATRIISLAKCIKLIGFEVVLVGLNKSFNKETKGVYEGIPFELLTFDELKLLGGFNRYKRARSTINALVNWIDNREKFKSIKAIVYSGGLNGLSADILKLSKKRNIPIIYNWVEWYQKPMFPGALGWIRYFSYLYDFHFVFPRFQNVIAISSLLEKYAIRHNCNTVRIPTIVDTDKYELLPPPNNHKLVLAYAGKIARKDLMVNAIKALELLSVDNRNLVEMHFYGISEKELLAFSTNKDSWPDYIGKQVFCEGFIPYMTVRNRIQKADFTILLRKQWKNANAGFPTKVGESMAAGVPVVSNITSDIGLYLHDLVEGIVCENESPYAFKCSIEKMLQLTVNEKINMRINARKQAELSFNYSCYQKQMKYLICNLKSSK